MYEGLFKVYRQSTSFTGFNGYDKGSMKWHLSSTFETLQHMFYCQLRGGYRYEEEKQDILALALGLRVPITLSLGNIRSFHSECRVCDLLYKQLDKNLYVDREILEAYICKALDGKLQSLWMFVRGSNERAAKIDLYKVEGSFNSERFFHRPITSPGSEKSLSRIREWMRQCTSHPRCQLDISGVYVPDCAKLPTRVISVGIHRTDVSLFVSGGQSANYVALSHCWGGVSLIQTKKSLLEEFQQCIKYADLSKTIQDAIDVTRELGIQYLWVDSLCIIQDDEKDWSRESKTMASVYEGAYFTIAATAAKNGTDGLFLPRPPQNLVKVPCNPMDPTSGYMFFGVKDETAVDRIFKGPLNGRAWVHQERMFSQRTIHFASEQLYWQCDKHFIAEDNLETNDPIIRHHHFVPTRSMLCYNLSCYLGKTQYPLPEALTMEEPFGSIADFHSLWAQNIVFFSRCGLTKASDKLPALFSLAKKLEEITKYNYHEGHWFDGSRFALTGLLWHSTGRTALQKVKSSRAPSWSWASLEGPFEYLDFNHWWVDLWHPQRWDMEILRVQNFQPLHRGPIKTLMLNTAKIPCSRCQCPVASILNVANFDAYNGLRFTRVISERGELITGSLEFDLEEDQPSDFWLIPVYIRYIEEEKKPVWFILMTSEILNQKKKGPSSLFISTTQGFALTRRVKTVKIFCGH
ncbi:hypothetical protein V502_00422 [Pseudogymnoascus sp. VKM F-4520 (FW-2644)]|nr:hypothetical protein V502_00422 [Pseudogymnoascus sp. VKM F-4520 (FW-2644)]